MGLGVMATVKWPILVVGLSLINLNVYYSAGKCGEELVIAAVIV